MKASRRILAAILSVCMAAGSMGMQTQAYDENGIQPKLAEERLTEEAEKGRNEDFAENLNVDEGMGQDLAEGSNVDEGMGQDLAEGSNVDEGVKEEQEIEGQAEDAEPGVLNFIMQESDYIETPGMQNVAVSLGEEGNAVEGAELLYRNTGTGQEFTAEAVGITDNMARFSMEYTSEEQSGIYELINIRWTQNGKSYQAILGETDTKVVYGVNQEVLAEPDDVLLDKELLEEVEANVVTMDGNGNAVSENTLEDILDSSQSSQALSPRIMARGAKKMVIVLDPGHDSTHSGASYHGYKEQDLVLKIAQYCKAELQKYGGITIYMTREAQSCPNGGSIVDSGTCNAKRVEFAAAKKADVYVSFHLNASASSSAKGVGVYYPNSNYKPSIGTEGKGLATEIYKKLSALGLSTWATGILIRNSESNTKYPDGSLADYLAIIRRSKLAGFPAVLIEHAFLSNSGDVSNFLNSEAKLKNLGVADAQGIAAYYKLTLAGEGTDDEGEEDEETGEPPVISSIQSRSSAKLRISWNEVADAVSYQVYRSDSADGEYAKIASVSGLKYDDGSVQAGKTYYYKVRTVYEEGKMSGLSREYSGKTLAQPKIASVVSKSSSQVQVTWNGVADATKYELFRSEESDSGYAKIATLKSGQTVYLDGNVKAQTTYYYKVRARGGEKTGYSSYSNVYSGWAVKKTKIISVSSKTKTSLEIKWNKVSKAYGYKIKRSLSKTKGYKTIATITSGSTTSYVDKKLKTGKTYYYKIQVLNKVNKKKGVSDYSKAASGTTITGTSMVYARSKNSSSMEVSWKKDPKATGYRIKRSTSKSGTYKVIANIKKNSTVKYTDKTITSGKKYYYVVESVVDKKGVPNYSGNSKPVTARNLKKVTGISMETEEQGLMLAWSEVAGANGYQIMRSENAQGPYTQVAKLTGADSSYTDTQAVIGNRYYYKIRALKSGKNAGYGSFTGALEKWALEAPEDFDVVAKQPEQVELSWESVSKAIGYEVFRSLEQDGEYESIAILEGIDTVTYIDAEVSSGEVYYYKVSAIGENKDGTGNGDETEPVSVQAGV